MRVEITLAVSGPTPATPCRPAAPPRSMMAAVEPTIPNLAISANIRLDRRYSAVAKLTMRQGSLSRVGRRVRAAHIGRHVRLTSAGAPVRRLRRQVRQIGRAHV